MPLFPVIARQRGLPEEGVGIIWTLTPITSASFNILNGTMADKFKIHRSLMQINTIIMAIFMTAFFFIPKFSSEHEIAIKGSLSVQCTANSNHYIFCDDNYSDVSVYENVTSCTAQNIFNTSRGMENCPMKCQISPTRPLEDVQQGEASHTSQSVSIRIPLKSLCDRGKCSHVEYISSSALANMSCDSTYDITCNHSCLNDEESKEMPLDHLLQTSAFWLTAFCLIISQGSFLSSSSLVDTLCHVALGKENHKFGQLRVFGAMGLGLMGLIGGSLVNYFSKGKMEPDYTAAIVITIGFQSISILTTKWINVTVPGKQAGSSSIGDVLCSLNFWLLGGTVGVTGLTYGTVWPFEFIYINEVAKVWDPAFDDSKLLQGLSLFVDCFIGEVLFFFFSAHIIKRMTTVHTFSLTLAATAIRILLYSFTTNPWLFLAIHLLHGPSFAVFFANMITSTGKMAPKGAQATLQSTVSAFFTLGRSLGALVGGISMRNLGGSRTYFILGIFVTCYTVFYAVLTCFVLKRKSHHTTGDNLGDYENANQGRRENSKVVNEGGGSGEQISGSVCQLDAMS